MITYYTSKYISTEKCTIVSTTGKLEAAYGKFAGLWSDGSEIQLSRNRPKKIQLLFTIKESELDNAKLDIFGSKYTLKDNFDPIEPNSVINGKTQSLK